MGSLTPGATYIYERQGGTIYAREIGAAPDTRIEIGWDWEPETNPSRVRGASESSVKENLLWYNIRAEAKTNPALQDALDRVKIIYELSRKDAE